MARREHVLALQREYVQLQALSAAEASGWQERREWAAIQRVQAAWRRRSSRRAFLEVVHRSQLHRRAKAATAIQRAQRTRVSCARSAPPSCARSATFFMRAAQPSLCAQRNLLCLFTCDC